MSSIILIGGSGFVGSHLQHLLEDRYDRIYIADIREPLWRNPGAVPLNPRSVYRHCDIRGCIDPALFPDHIETIVNLAAIHTSPGHPSHEYFATNITGAQSVCALAEAKHIERMVFTSSIAVYGPGEDEKTEDDVPMPAIPYGSSKIVAEYIHREWLQRGSGRSLSILRPAVIFGAGEGGNFTRIANALERGIFAYPGRRDTIKGCLYVKDLCRCIIDRLDCPTAYSLYNVCYPDKLTIEEIVSAIKRTLGYRSPEYVLPLWSINAAALIARGFPHPAIRRMNLDPQRIAKLVHSTNISARKLVDAGFRFHYPLEIALRDWAVDCRGASLR